MTASGRDGGKVSGTTVFNDVALAPDEAFPLPDTIGRSVFDVGGASAVQPSALLDRHWRNLRTLFSHNPTVYKARVLGDVVVNGADPPQSSFF